MTVDTLGQVERYRTLLQCATCRGEQVHEVTYLGTVIACIRCSCCGERVGPAPAVLIDRYVRDFEWRVIRKPGKVLRHAKRHPIEFWLHYLPHGLLHKPGEILKELGTLADAASGPHAATDTKAGVTAHL
jgi:hypothetical protein